RYDAMLAQRHEVQILVLAAQPVLDYLLAGPERAAHRIAVHYAEVGVRHVGFRPFRVIGEHEKLYAFYLLADYCGGGVEVFPANQSVDARMVWQGVVSSTEMHETTAR